MPDISSWPVPIPANAFHWSNSLKWSRVKYRLPGRETGYTTGIIDRDGKMWCTVEWPAPIPPGMHPMTLNDTPKDDDLVLPFRRVAFGDSAHYEVVIPVNVGIMELLTLVGMFHLPILKISFAGSISIHDLMTPSAVIIWQED